MKIIDCGAVRDKLLLEVKEKIVNIDKRIEIVVISIGDNNVNDIYIRQKKKIFESLGIGFRIIRLNSDVEEREILRVIDELNSSETITGIMIELPIMGNFDRDRIVNRIDYRKDVDGLTFVNRERLLRGDTYILSSTVEAILEIFKYYDIILDNKRIVIIGNGVLVGKPLSVIFKKWNLDFVICDSKTKNIDNEIIGADIIISCVGKREIISSSLLKDGQVVIDVGVSTFDGVSYGDIERSNIDNVDCYITPIRGGVGVVTVVSLVKNLIKCYELNKK